jgi:peptide/nickel transport system substrate-binding protein
LRGHKTRFSRVLASFSLFLWAVYALGCSADPSQIPTGTDAFPVPSGAKIIDCTGNHQGNLNYALAGEPDTFNLLAAQDYRSRLVAYLTTGTLLEYDADTQSVVGGIARSYVHSDNGRIVRMELREGLRFSDGQPLSAEDVIFTFSRIYEEDSGNVLKDTLLVDDEPLEIRKIDDLTIEVEFAEAFAAAPYLLTTVPVFPRHLVGGMDRKIEEYWTLDTSPDEMAGLGPFRITAHEPGRRTVLERNLHYWKVDSTGNRLPYLDKMTIEYVEDRNTQLLRFKAGELDLLDQLLRPEDYQLLSGDSGIKAIDAGPSGNLTFFWFNLAEGVRKETGKPYLDPEIRSWFGNRLFRQALSCAVNRHSIVQNVFLERATLAHGLIPESNSNWFTRDIPIFSYDPDRARALLSEAGFSLRKVDNTETLTDTRGRTVEFELLTRADDVLGKIAAIIQEDLRAIGISVTIRQEEFRSVISRIMRSRDYHSALMNLEFPGEPADIMNVISSSGAMHMWNPMQPEPATEWEARIDQMMSRQLRVLDPQERFSLFREVQQTMATEVPFIPLVNKNILVACRNTLRNVRTSNVFPYTLWNSWELSLSDQ